jgi:hypothetical protein
MESERSRWSITLNDEYTLYTEEEEEEEEYEIHPHRAITSAPCLENTTFRPIKMKL